MLHSWGIIGRIGLLYNKFDIINVKLFMILGSVLNNPTNFQFWYFSGLLLVSSEDV